MIINDDKFKSLQNFTMIKRKDKNAKILSNDKIFSSQCVDNAVFGYRA